MSLSRRIIARPESAMSCAWCRCSEVSSPASSSSVKPITPFIGVRISWLMFARKLDLTFTAASARSRALSSWISSSLRSVTSRADAMISQGFRSDVLRMMRRLVSVHVQPVGASGLRVRAVMTHRSAPPCATR